MDVPASRVWRALIDPGLIRVWSGLEAEIDPRQGGLYRLGKRADGGREAHIDVFEVNRRLRLIYQNSRDLPPSDSALVDDFLLDADRIGDGQCSLRLLGSGIPEAVAWDKGYMRIRQGWERFMARIKVTVEKPPVSKKRKLESPQDPPLAGLDY